MNFRDNAYAACSGPAMLPSLHSSGKGGAASDLRVIRLSHGELRPLSDFMGFQKQARLSAIRLNEYGFWLIFLRDTFTPN
jgi:hypothetical protein